ncbi:S8 family peptidase [Alicyclobacillus shizuokensis]|uniref:S8 family peptidase n=1 Tax=Alicyclobacillus shizuokensis TaxID=392014 RepID=UPI00082C65AF|nr:S8 family peptidase [Alicyclobacillus shizuokensis]
MQERFFTTDAHDLQMVRAEQIGVDYVDWGLQVIMAPEVWNKSIGQGVKVGILDTGVDFTHPDLRDNIAAYMDFTGSPAGPRDVEGHGTHVAGIIAAESNNVGLVGVAPGAKLYCAKVLGDNGSGGFDAIIRGIDWLIQQGVDVINMSLGCSVEPPQEVHQAIQRAAAAGIVICAACGNENTDVGWPAKYDETIAVSAMGMDYNRAEFSNHGVKNEIIAPGVDILSTFKGSTYARLSGTSMATPIVTGSVALYISMIKAQTGKRPPAEQIHAAIDASAVHLGKEGRNEDFGVGLINLVKLLGI